LRFLGWILRFDFLVKYLQVTVPLNFRDSYYSPKLDIKEFDLVIVSKFATEENFFA
jgi:hypothetical protein